MVSQKNIQNAAAGGAAGPAVPADKKECDNCLCLVLNECYKCLLERVATHRAKTVSHSLPCVERA